MLRAMVMGGIRSLLGMSGLVFLAFAAMHANSGAWVDAATAATTGVAMCAFVVGWRGWLPD